jgi:hypothetical protein
MLPKIENLVLASAVMGQILDRKGYSLEVTSKGFF